MADSRTETIPTTRFEELFEAASDGTGGLGKAFSDASRAAREELTGLTPEEEIVRDVGAGVLAPVMTAFCLWLLRRADELGLRRLYFLSRDGHLVLEVARILAPRLGLDIDLRYFLCSRKAFVPACITSVTVDQLAMAFEDSPFFSVRVCCERLGLAPEAVGDALVEGGFGEGRWERNLGPTERDVLHQLVLDEPRIAQAILENAESRRDVLWDFLVQESLLDGTPSGLVDLGWKASTQQALCRLVATHHRASGGAPCRPFGLYFGLDFPTDIADVSAVDAEGYFADARRQSGFWRSEVPQLAAILEPMCTIGHGTVTGYRRKDGRVEAVLASSKSSVYEKWHFDVLRKTVRRFAGHIDPAPDMAIHVVDLVQPLHDAILALWLHPTRSEAGVWGKLPLGDRLGAIDFSDQFAKAHSWQDVVRTLSEGVIREPEGSIWFAGSFVQDSLAMRLLLSVARRVGSVAQALLRLLKGGRRPVQVKGRW